jgi:hypothetical protein
LWILVIMTITVLNAALREDPFWSYQWGLKSKNPLCKDLFFASIEVFFRMPFDSCNATKRTCWWRKNFQARNQSNSYSFQIIQIQFAKFETLQISCVTQSASMLTNFFQIQNQSKNQSVHWQMSFDSHAPVKNLPDFFIHVPLQVHFLHLFTPFDPHLLPHRWIFK